MVRLLRHRQTKGPETDRPHLNHRATPRLHKLEIHLDAYGVYQACGFLPIAPNRDYWRSPTQLVLGRLLQCHLGAKR